MIEYIRKSSERMMMTLEWSEHMTLLFVYEFVYIFIILKLSRERRYTYLFIET